MKRILLLDNFTYPEKSLIELEIYFDVYYSSVTEQNQFDKILKENSFYAIFTKLGLNLGEEQIKQQEELKYIITPTTGINHINCEFASQKNIEIISLKGHTDFLKQIRSTAEHIWLLILAISRNFYSAVIDVKQNNRWNRVPFLSEELNEKTIGIIGYGRLGKIIAKYANAFGMKIFAYDIDDTKFSKIDLEYKSTLNYLLNNSDYVVLLISWSIENENFFNSLMFNEMKSTAYFINASRGELVDEKSLLFFLEKNLIAGAALDVLNGDSTWNANQSISNELINFSKTHSNLIITPHMGGYSVKSILLTREFCVNLFLNIFKQ